MKKKILILSLATFYLSGASLATNNYTDIASRDTVPAAKEAKKAKPEKQTKSEAAFDDLEKELNAINKKGKTDTTKIRVGKLKIQVIDDGDNVVIQKEKGNEEWENWGNWDHDNNDFGSNVNQNFKPHWASIAIGLNNYMTADQSLTLPDTAQYLDLNTNRSMEVCLNVAELGIPIVKHRVGLVTGVGFKWNNYNFRNSNVVLHPDSSILYHTVNDTIDFSKSKLSVFYLTVPFMLEFQVPVQEKPMYLAAGVEAGLKIGSRTKMKSPDGIKNRYKNDFHVNPYTLALAARLGYDAFGIYASYNMTTLFKADEGPELYPFAMGITINF